MALGGRHLPPPLLCTALCASWPHVTHLATKTVGIRNGKAVLALWLHLLELTESKLQVQIMNLARAIFLFFLVIFQLEFHSMLKKR